MEDFHPTHPPTPTPTPTPAYSGPEAFSYTCTELTHAVAMSYNAAKENENMSNLLVGNTSSCSLPVLTAAPQQTQGVSVKAEPKEQVLGPQPLAKSSSLNSVGTNSLKIKLEPGDAARMVRHLKCTSFILDSYHV